MGDDSRLTECALWTLKSRPLPCETFVIYMKAIGFFFYMKF